MKSSLLPSISVRLVLVLSAVFLLSADLASARYGAFVYSKGKRSFGAWALSWNWGTANAAVNAAARTARNRNRGVLQGYHYVWWARPGFEAGARGYSRKGTKFRVGWSNGWRTRPAAINNAVKRLGGQRYDLGYTSGYNR